MSVDYLLHESSVGYALLEVTHKSSATGNRLKEVQDSMQDLARFGKMVKIKSFLPFAGAAQALENINEISEGIAPSLLISLLSANLPQTGKNNKIVLGIADKNLAGSIKASLPGVDCETGDTSEVVGDLLRGIRQHASKLLSQLQEGDVERAQLGLGHAYSRSKVKFSVQKNDNHIIQAIAHLDHLDKSINTHAMRIREWYSWHFPELIKIVSENHAYTRLALYIGDKKRLSDDDLHDLAAQVGDDEETAKSIIAAAKVSMGQDFSQTDMDTLAAYTKQVVGAFNSRKALQSYLISKMSIVAPNLTALIGESVGARLISHAGSLTNLAKYPASTVQILGAEKALFRALKTKGNTPKYGLIYHSSFIGKAGLKNKGRISRFLANKCSIASRIDNFSEAPTTAFGDALRKQVEDRLTFYSTGAAPSKNADVMKAAMDSVLQDINVDMPAEDSDVEVADLAPRAVQKQEKQKEDKKDKKARKEEKRKRKLETGVEGGESKKKKKSVHVRQ